MNNLKISFHLQNIVEKRNDILSDDRDKTLHNHLIDESRKVAQFLQDAFRPGQLFLQLLLVSHMEMNGFTASIWLFSIFQVQLQLLVCLVAVLFYLGIKEHNCNKKHIDKVLQWQDFNNICSKKLCFLENWPHAHLFQKRTGFSLRWNCNLFFLALKVYSWSNEKNV